MNKTVKTLSRCALFTALGVAFIYISSFVPTARIALIAVAGLLTAAGVIHCGVIQGFEVYLATAALSLLIIPDKGNALLYAVFLGFYPALKSVLEKRIRNKAYCWLVKLAVFNAVLALVLMLADWLLLEGLDAGNIHRALLQLAGNAVFIVYDIGLSRLIAFYISRFSKYIH